LGYITGEPDFLCSVACGVFDRIQCDAPAALTDFQLRVVEYHHILHLVEYLCLAGCIFPNQMVSGIEN
jgi:hypothetical protein